MEDCRYEVIGTEHEYVRLKDTKTGKTFALDRGLYEDGNYTGDKKYTLSEIIKEKLPKKDQYRYPIIITIGREHYIGRVICDTSCDTIAQLTDIMFSIFNEQREGNPDSFYFSFQADKQNCPDDIGSFYIRPASYGMLI